MDFVNYKTDTQIEDKNKKSVYQVYNNAYTTYRDNPKQPRNTLKDALTGVSVDIEKLTGLFEKYKSNSIQEGMTVDEVKSKYDNILQTRQDLEQKLYELYTNDYDSLYSVKSMVDSTVITGVLWTVLATSIIYYIVVKL
jgi:hypothetical protein